MHGTILTMKLIRDGIIDADGRKLQSRESEGSTHVNRMEIKCIGISYRLSHSSHVIFKVPTKKDNEAYLHINVSMKKLTTRAICPSC